METKLQAENTCCDAGFSVRSVYVLVLRMGIKHDFLLGAYWIRGNIRSENTKILMFPFLCEMYQAISRKFVSRTSLARTCVSVTSHLVQVVSAARSQFFYCFLKLWKRSQRRLFRRMCLSFRTGFVCSSRSATDGKRSTPEHWTTCCARRMEVWRAASLFQVLHRQQAKLKKAHHNLKFLTDKVSESTSFVQQRHQGP